MRPAVLAGGVIIGLAWVIAIVHGRLRLDPFARGRAAPHARLVATTIEPDQITTSAAPFGVVGYHLPLPAGLSDADSVEVRFRDALDGAKVDAEATGPRSHARLLRKRVGGDTVTVPLAPGRIDAVDLRVRHGLRPPPILRAAVVFAPPPATPAAAGPPLAASPRSTR